MYPENNPYIVQLLRLGMLLENPDELDSTDPRHFGDAVLADVVRGLQERRKAKKPKNGEGLIPLERFLESVGCERGMRSVEDARSAIRDRLEVDGQFGLALMYLAKHAKLSVEMMGQTSEAKRAFTEAVRRGAGTDV